MKAGDKVFIIDGIDEPDIRIIRHIFTDGGGCTHILFEEGGSWDESFGSTVHPFDQKLVNRLTSIARSYNRVVARQRLKAIAALNEALKGTSGDV